MLELQQFDASTDHARVSPRNALVGMTGIGSKSTSLLDTGGGSSGGSGRPSLSRLGLHWPWLFCWPELCHVIEEATHRRVLNIIQANET
jgi:hypothetical protein